MEVVQELQKEDFRWSSNQRIVALPGTNNKMKLGLIEICVFKLYWFCTAVFKFVAVLNGVFYFADSFN